MSKNKIAITRAMVLAVFPRRPLGDVPLPELGEDHVMNLRMPTMEAVMALLDPEQSKAKPFANPATLLHEMACDGDGKALFQNPAEAEEWARKVAPDALNRVMSRIADIRAGASPTSVGNSSGTTA